MMKVFFLNLYIFLCVICLRYCLLCEEAFGGSVDLMKVGIAWKEINHKPLLSSLLNGFILVTFHIILVNIYIFSSFSVNNDTGISVYSILLPFILLYIGAINVESNFSGTKGLMTCYFWSFMTQL